MACTGVCYLELLIILLLTHPIVLGVMGFPATSYIVYMGSHHTASVEAGDILSFHQELLVNAMGSEESAEGRLVYSYKHAINGFAAVMEPSHASALAAMPGVVSVFENKAHQLHTTRSWEFLGLEYSSGAASRRSLWTKSKFGEDVIIGVMDTGVWPESESFSDQDFGTIPARWNGTCEVGSNFTRFNCNRKLIGARHFIKGYEAANGMLNVSSTGEFLSARDKEGHGTHTASTAGGNFVEGASIFGFAKGTAKGGAPRARLAVYKVCWPGGCYDADILAAFDAGIRDGVDVFSLSLGSGPPLVDYFADAIAIGSFHAVSSGKVVVCSAGNDGPSPASVANVAPWILTVAASSIDRAFPAFTSLGDGSNYTGASLSESRLPRGRYPLVYSGDVHLPTANASAGRMCFRGSLDPKKVKGKIVACMRGVNPRVEKGSVVKEAGGVGLLLLNQPSDAEEIISDPHVLPASQLAAAHARSVLAYINQSRSSATAFITHPTTLLRAKPAPQMASFSSQGPNSLTPDILKPDISAPGLNILAAWTEASAPTADSSDHRLVKYNVISGTSMSCPHVAGIVALLRALHPTWSAAAIKSALMTSATHHDNSMRTIRNGSMEKATPFNYGSGHVNPNAAADPGLLYDASPEDYFLFVCGLRHNRSSMVNLTGNTMSERKWKCPQHPPSLLDLNYPSFALSRLPRNVSRTVLRTVTYVGGHNNYEAIVRPPRGVRVQVVPSRLSFSALGQKLQFRVTFSVMRLRNHNEALTRSNHVPPAGAWAFGSLIWTDGTRRVSSPIAVALY
ncbi:hypothetical protein GOP47_0024019 [Adiantum capillus-veneris]|uniref:Subtilisin-like protease SBT5.3 n=1 Tax=Adiantum capillus-veneris TaxID=13818 RepID=A0A9D4U6R4_ADICA|nr:hypothetical protein GOP47_0024019 [Adiantum capillus-veneris]